MAIITQITVQAKDKNRCNLYLDGKFFCGLNIETVVKNKLKVGVSVTEAEIATIQYDSEKLKALEKATNYLSKALKTERQMKDYLFGKGYGDAIVFFVIDKLKEYGYIDDLAYAESFVKTYKEKKGERLIRYELRQKGVDDGVISDALGLLEQQENPAIALAEKFFEGKEVNRELVQKLYRRLLSKGFSYEQIKQAIDRVYQGDDYD